MARSKQERRKKAAPEQAPAPQAAHARQGAGAVEARGAVDASPSPARSRQTGRVPLLLTAVLCLLLGTYLGTLLPAFRDFKDLVSSGRQSPRPEQAPAPAAQGAGGSDHLKALEAAVVKNPQDLHAWIQLGNQYFDNHKPREAIRAYERALTIKGDNPDVLTDMGIMYRQLGEFERAAEHFTQAGKTNPLHEQSRFNLGVVLFFDLKRKEEARQVWRALIAINPEAKTPDGALLRTMLDELP